MRKCFFLLLAAALFPAAGSAQLTPEPMPPGSGLSANGSAISVIYDTTAGTAAQGNDSRIVGAVQAAGGNASATTSTATGSTTARTLAARAASIINVRDYGVTCNGTTDDTAAFQAAINAVEANGTAGQLYMPRPTPGAVCKISSTLTINQPFNWIAEGWFDNTSNPNGQPDPTQGMTLRWAGGAAPMIRIKSAIGNRGESPGGQVD